MMLSTVIDTEGLPAADRFLFWQELTARMLVPTRFRSDHVANFSAKIHAVDLAGIQLVEFTCPPLTSCRTPKLIRSSDPEFLELGIFVGGLARLSQDRRTGGFEAPDMTLYTSSRPFEAVFGQGSAAVVRLPRGRLPLSERRLRSLVCERIPGGGGLGVLVRQCVLELIRNADRYNAADEVRLGNVVADLIAAALAHQLGADETLSPDTQHAALFAQVQAFIDQHLADPGLSPQVIAAAHHISPRLLYRLFSAHGVTVAGLIRDLRMERIRRDLADPALLHRKIYMIAASWGFDGGPAHFSRAFKDAHGLSPSDYRERALGLGDGGWAAAGDSGRAPYELLGVADPVGERVDAAHPLPGSSSSTPLGSAALRAVTLHGQEA
jgi:AraC-like DNA-binding protein